MISSEILKQLHYCGEVWLQPVPTGSLEVTNKRAGSMRFRLVCNERDLHMIDAICTDQQKEFAIV